MDKAEKELLTALSSVGGLISEYDALALYNAAKSLPTSATIVEIGSFKGKSTICLATGLRDAGNHSARVYAIDPFEGQVDKRRIFPPTWDQFIHNIRAAAVEKYVIPLKMSSLDASRQWDGKEIHLLWVDGLHDYSHVKQDLVCWKPFLAQGARVMMDDLFLDDVRKAFVEEFVYSKEFCEMDPRGYLGRVTKKFCAPCGMAEKMACFWAWNFFCRLKRAARKAIYFWQVKTDW